jgi:ppGpp synthetase/RelA/SpoT-type nucleotidyltranferase
MDVDRLREDYQALVPKAERFATALADRFSQLLKQRNIALAVPIRHRVKAWESIADTIERKSLALEDLTELPDLVGLRLIMLFGRDLEKTHRLISETFTVHGREDREDTAERLDVARFGYQSFHHVIELPESWLEAPAFADFAELKAEVQTRTLARHVWAAVSHRLPNKLRTKRTRASPKVHRSRVCTS